MATVFNAITATQTIVLEDIAGLEGISKAGFILLEVVGATSPSWTLDIQGRASASGTYTNLDYHRVWATPRTITAAQISITNTTRRFYAIPNPPPFVQLVATRTAGTLTILAYYTTSPFTAPSGDTQVEGTVAESDPASGNPVPSGGRYDATLRSLADGDRGELSVDLNADLVITGRFQRIRVTKTRPADTTAYSIDDIISESTTAGTPWGFAAAAKRNGGTGYITKAILDDDDNARTWRGVLLLFSVTPTGTLNDNAINTEPVDADADNFIGMVQFDALIDYSSSGHSIAMAVPGDPKIPLKFTCESGDDDIYGVLVTLDAFTPTSGEIFAIILEIEQL